MDGATPSSFLTPGGGYLCKTRCLQETDRLRGCSRGACTHFPTDMMASAGKIHLLGRQTAANIFPSPYCIITCDLTNHQPHSAEDAVELSSIYAEAANRNHPLWGGSLVSSHWPLVVMDVNEGQGRDKDWERPLGCKKRLSKSSTAL